MTTNNDKILLIDTDLVIHRIAAACEREVDWGDGTWSIDAREDDGEATLFAFVEDLADKINADYIWFCIGEGRNFRYDVFPEYKGNRKGKRRPILFSFLMDCVKNTYQTFTLNGVETDDVIGLAYTDPDWEDSECIMVTADKDLHQICGWVYNPFEDNPKVRGIHQIQADIWHMVQTLAGDSADNYKGCPGYGEVRARRLVSKAHAGGSGGNAAVWREVVKAFEKAGLTEEDALVQAQIARICRYGDYNYEKQEAILWQPPMMKGE